MSATGITIYTSPVVKHIHETCAEEWIGIRNHFTCKVGNFTFIDDVHNQIVTGITLDDDKCIMYGTNYYLTIEGRQKVEKLIADYHEAKKKQTIPLDAETRLQVAAIMLFKGTPEQRIEALTYLGCSKAFIEFVKNSELRHEFSRTNAGPTVQSGE